MRIARRKRKDRLERTVGVQTWQTWVRNEIENYLIEPEVIVPVIAEYFQTNDQLFVQNRLESVVACLRVDQAAQFALYQFWQGFRHSTPLKSRYIGGLPKRTARPCWSADKREMIAPETAIVKNALEKVLTEKADLHHRDSKLIDCGKFLDQFDQKCREWNTVTVASRDWRIEWAGKDILLCLSRWLAAEVGIRIPPSLAQTRVDWDALARREKRQWISHEEGSGD